MSETAIYSVEPELGGLEFLRARFQHQHFSRHTHQGFTIGVIQQGAQRFWRNGGYHIAGPGSIILVNEDQLHDGHSAARLGWQYRALYPTTQQLQQLFDGSDLATGPGLFFPTPVVEDSLVSRKLALAMDAFVVSRSTLARDSLLLDALRCLVLRQGRARSVVRGCYASDKSIATIRDLLREQPECNLSLQQLAQMANLSPYQLLRQFKQDYGLPPHQYQIQARVHKAKQLLRNGVSAVAVAADTGFHDQSHLHRHFKRMLGVTPGQYSKSFR